MHMAIRRQGFEWQVRDLGQLPVKRLEDLSNSPQSIFISGIGNATITKRNRTADDEFLVLQYTGSSPGIWPNSGNDWKPRGYINFIVETTAYFVNPDGLPAQGMPGTAAPFPVTTAFSPVVTDYIPIEIPPDTNWDITYFLGNSLVEPIETFPVPFVYSFNTAGVENAPILTYPGEGTVDQRLVVNVAGSIVPTISGGEPDTCTISPALPAGLTIDNTTGIISGTPTVTVAAKDYTITATNTAGSTTSALRFEVDNDPPQYLYNGTVGNLFTLTKDVTSLNAFPVKIGGPDATLFFLAASLPAGLAYDASNGNISGIATVISPNTFYSVVLQGPSGNGSATFRIEVLGNVPVISYPDFSTPTTLLTDQIVSASPTNTGGAVTAGYAVTAGTLPAGLSLDAGTGVISGVPSAITAAADITITATGADGPGSTIVNLTVDAGVPQFDYGSPLNPVENVAASFTPTTGFSPITSYALDGGAFPSGLGLNTTTGEISGTASFGSAAPYEVRITATGPGGTSFPLPVTIDVIPGVPSITYAGSPYSATEGLEFSASPTSTGGAPSSYAVTAGVLPDGMSLNPTTGQIFGPNLDVVGQVRNFTITGSNVSGSSAAAVQITTVP